MNALMTSQLWVLSSINPTTLQGFSNFQQEMDRFFREGLGGDGASGLGIAIMVLGFVGAGVSFALHKFNPQSRAPGWISLLIVGVFGSFLTFGAEPAINAFNWAANQVRVILGI